MDASRRLRDVYDALTSERPYKHAWTVEEAVKEIKLGNSSHFDPQVLEAFLGALPDIINIRSEHRDDLVILQHAD